MIDLRNGDCREELKKVPDGSVNCCVTSPPYWGLRDYGVDGQVGLEETPEKYVAAMVGIFREVRRVLRDDGVLWLNIGDCYSSHGAGAAGKELSYMGDQIIDRKARAAPEGLKPKDLCGIPWRVAFALQADGWWLRNDIIWNKPNPMPESVRDRCTRAHEYIFHLTKSAKYWYDADAIREPIKWEGQKRTISEIESHVPGAGNHKGLRAHDVKTDKQRGHSRRHAGFYDRWDEMTKEEQQACGANKRTVWTVPTRPMPEAHFATFPKKLIEPCILAGCPEGGVVLDPFAGTGTVGECCREHNRRAILIELSGDYCELARKRCIDGRLSF